MTTRVLRKPSVQYVAHNAITHGAMRPVRVVLHDTESHDTKGITDVKGIYDFWVEQGKGYGAHLVIDKDGNTGMAEPGFVHEMWHVGNYNGGSIGIEQIGFASFTKLIWSRAHQKQLIKVARWLAWLHTEYHIPLVRSTNHGVCTHWDVGRAGIDNSGHTDPGRGYPMRTILWLANRYVKRGGWSKDQPI
jgi:hypothetical protein